VLTNTDGQLEEAKNKLEHVLQNIFNSINT